MVRLARSAFFLIIFLTFLSGWTPTALSAPADNAADKNQITIAISKDSALYHKIATSLKDSIEQELPGSHSSTVVPGAQLQAHIASTVNTRLIIAVGTSATRRALELPETDIPILSVFLPKHTFEKLLTSDKRYSQRKIGAVFLDQPLQRQLNFSRLLLPEASKVGVLYGTSSEDKIPRLNALAKRSRLDLSSVRINPDDEQRNEIRQFVSSIDFMLAVPDPEVHTRARAKYLLYTSYQNSTPIIAFSNSYVRAGALAAIFSSPENVARQAAEVAADFINSKDASTLPRVLPRYFSVTLNPSVARSLNIPLPDKQQIEVKLRAMEQQQRAQANE